MCQQIKKIVCQFNNPKQKSLSYYSILRLNKSQLLFQYRIQNSNHIIYTLQMTYRQRNIPVTSKEEIEVQTDVRLLQSYLLDHQGRQESSTEHSTIHLSKIYGRSGLLRPFSDHHLLREFASTLKDLKQSQYNEKDFAKRLELLEGQIEGLMKRDLLINGVVSGSQSESSYYSTLNQKEKDIIRLQNQKAYSNQKIQRLRVRIQQLELQVQDLRVSLVNSHKIIQENRNYASVFEKLNTIVTNGKKKGLQIETLLSEQITPLVNEFTFSLTTLNKTINRDFNNSTKLVVNNFAKEFDRLIKQQQFTEDKLQETINSLLTNFKAVKGIEHMRRQFDLAIRAEESEENYKNILSLFKSQIENLKNEIPNLKGVERLDLLLSKLDVSGVKIIESKGWMTLVDPQIKVIEVSQNDKQLKELIGTLGAQFRRIYTKFPEIKTQISSKISSILESEVLTQLIEGGSLEYLQSIVFHQVSQIKVDNIYKYQSSSQKQTIFHLKVLIKCLLEELDKIKKNHGIDFILDEGILGLLKEQIIEGVNIQQFIGLFRPLSKYVSVPVILDNPIYQTKTYEKGVPIYVQKPVIFDQKQMQVVTINKEVPVYIEKPIDGVFVSNVPVSLQTQKAVPIQVNKDVLVDRIVQQSIQCPVSKQKSVAVYDRVETVKEVPLEEIIIENIKVEFEDKLVQVKGQKQYVEIEKIVEKPYYIYETKQQIREVDIMVPYIVKQPEIREIEKIVNHVIEKKEIVYIKEDVPIEIKVPQVHYIQLIQYRDKMVISKEFTEKILEVEVVKQKQIIKEVPVEIYIERSHFIKGDVVQVYKEVQVFVDKPIIRQILVTKDTEIEKVVPMYITQQIPVITELPVPYQVLKIKELEVQKVRLIPVKQEIIKEVIVQKPVPVIVEKQVVRIEKQIIQKIVQKIVQVPRIVQIERIVEKIVVVPRIVQKIVQVPKIIQKIVVIQQPILQIVEIYIPQIIIQQVERIVQVYIDRPIIQYQKQIQKIEVERIVEKIIERQRPVEVFVEKRIPYEVIRQIPVPTYRDRIEYQKVEIFDTKVQAIQVQVPLIVQSPVPMIVEKYLQTKTIIENPVMERCLIEKPMPIVTQIEKLVVKEITVQKAVESQYAVEIPIQKIVYVEVPNIIQVVRDKIVQIHDSKQVPKEIYLQIEKIVYQVRQKLIEVAVNKIVPTPQLIEVPKIVSLVHYKEIPVDVPVREERMQRDIVQSIKQVKSIEQVLVEVQICREKIKQIVNQVTKFITNQVTKNITNEILVQTPPIIEKVEIQGQTIIQQLFNSTKEVITQDKIIERLVQKIVMMPQIVEVVRNIHHISEVNSLGAAVDVDLNVQIEKYLGVSGQLKKGLLQLLASFKSNVGRQPDLKNLIVIIQKYIKYIEDWINFPKLIEIPKQIIKEVEKDRIVLVPTVDKEKQATMGYIIQKLLNQLRRIRDSHKITLNLQQDLLRIFLSDKKAEEGLEKKLTDLQQQLKIKYSSFGQWSQTSPFLVNSFLQEHFSLNGLVQEANRNQLAQTEQIDSLRSRLQIATNKYNNLLCYNRKMFDDNNKLIKTLERYRSSIDDEEYTENITTHKKFYEQISEQKHSVVISTIKRNIQTFDSQISGQFSHSQFQVDTSGEIGDLINKISRYEGKTQDLQAKSKKLENDLNKTEQELRIKNSIIKRLETDFDSRLTRAREELSKNPNLSKDLFEETKKLQQKNRTLEREISSERANIEKSKKQIERSLQNQKRDYERELERKEKEIKQLTEKTKREIQRQANKIKLELEKIKKDKERVDQELIQSKKKSSEEIKTIRQTQLTGASDKYNQLINENIELRKKSDGIEGEYEKLKKGALENNSANEKQILRLRQQVQKLTAEKRQWDRAKKVGLLDVPQQSQIINKNIELEKKIKNLEVDLDRFKGKDQSSTSQIKILRERVKKLQIQLETSKRQVEAVQKSRVTTYQSGFKPAVSIVENIEGSVVSSVVRSPRSPTYKSGFREYVSPAENSSMSREQKIEQFGSSSSRVSQSSEDQSLPAYYKAQMTLRQFIDAKHSDDKQRDMYVTLVMIKVIEKIQEEADGGIFNSYSPNNIHLSNFNVKNLDKLIVKFGAPITKTSSKSDSLYLAPEILGGASNTKKSTVFCFGVILDELIHGSTFFKSTDQIKNLQNEFKVRGQKLNPILKNTLFEMMNKEPNKRLELVQAKRRLSLQKYITSESKTSISTTTRLTRKPQQE